MIPYAGSEAAKKYNFAKIQALSLQSELKKVNEELYQLRGENVRLQRELRIAKGELVQFHATMSVIADAVGSHDIVTKNNPGFCSLDDVVNAVAFYYGLAPDSLRGNMKIREITHARQIAMYMASVASRASMAAIGRHLGNRDHTTVMHGVRKINRLQLEDPATAQDLALIKDKLKSAPSGALAAVPSPDPPSRPGAAALTLSPTVGNDGSVGEVSNA